MGLRNTLASWLLGNNYTEMALHEGHVRTLFDDRVVQACENATRLTAYTASRCNVSVEGDLGGAWQDIVRPGRFIQVLVRDLLKTGNYVAEITDPPALRRVSSFEIHGKRSIRYRLTHAYPDGETVRNLPQEAVCHVMVNEEPGRPWEGRSPFLGVELLTALEWGLLDLAGLRNKRVIASPTPATNPDTAMGQQDHQHDMVGEIFSRSGTEVMFMQTSRGGMDTLKSVDLKFAPDQYAVELRRDLISQIYECVGIPPTLRGEAVPGQAYKTALSEWIDGHLQPMMDSVGEQLSESLESDILFDLSPAKVPQVQDQAKIVAELVSAQVPMDEAKRIAGL